MSPNPDQTLANTAQDALPQSYARIDSASWNRKSPLPDIQRCIMGNVSPERTEAVTSENSPFCTDEILELTTMPDPPDDLPKSIKTMHIIRHIRRKSRRKRDKHADKTWNRKKKSTKLSAKGRFDNKGSRPVHAKTAHAIRTVPLDSSENAEDGGNGDSICTEDNYLTEQIENSEIRLKRSITSVAFGGPGFIRSPSNMFMSPKTNLVSMSAKTNLVSSSSQSVTSTSAMKSPCNFRFRFESESMLRLPTIQTDTNTKLYKSSSNPEISLPWSPLRRAKSDNRRPLNSSVPPIRETSSESTDRKKHHVALLVAIKPENHDAEKEKFTRQKYKYEPQFSYKYPANPDVLEKFTRPSKTLLPVAEKIMKKVLVKYGSFEQFVETTGGKKLNRMQIVEAAKKYLNKEKLSEEVSVQLSDDLLSRACMTRIRGQPTLLVRTNEIREFWIDGMLRHEIGTHYIRSSNNRYQTWKKSQRRRDLKLLPLNPTEEGLAALHSIIKRPEPSLFRCALLYYTAYRAAELSFSQLHKDLRRFVKNPSVRWDYCMRAKRGLTDTSKPGTFNKDQVYLTGALSILKHRATIDFHALVKCGKVDFRDVDRLKELSDLENTRIPSFMANIARYRKHLDDIVMKNGLTAEDLEPAT